MTDVLILQPPRARAEQTGLGWSVVRSGAVIAEGVLSPGDMLEPPQTVQIDHAVVLLPAEDVFVRRLPVPGQSERDARRAAPFLIEDHLAQSLEDVQVALGPVGADGARWLTAVDRTRLKAWREMLAGVLVKPVYALSDALALEGQDADLAVMSYGDRIVFKTRTGDLAEAGSAPARDLDAALSDPVCGAIEPHLLAPVLSGVGHRLAPRRILISPDLDLSALAQGEASVSATRIKAPDLRFAAAALTVSQLESLPRVLGEGFAASVDWAGLLKPWRWAAGLALTALISATALMAVQAAYLEDRAERYDAAQAEAFRTLFPDARIVNVPAQMRQALNTVRGGAEGGAGFLPLASALAEIVREVDDVRVDSVRFDASRGELSVSALYSGFGDFERLRRAAEARGVVLEDGGARQSAAGVSAEFTVRLP